MNYDYISKTFGRLPLYYVIFFGVLSFILFLEIFNFNENLLIGTLFTIGTFTTIFLLQSSFSTQMEKNIVDLKNKFSLRKNLIDKYKFFYAKIVYYYLLYYINVRFNLINLKFVKLLRILKKKLKKINYLKIFNKLYFLNYFSLYYFSEKNAVLFLWLNSIKSAYNHF